MFQQKIDDILKDLLNVFGITDDILIVGYDVDGKDHNRKLVGNADMQSRDHLEHFHLPFQKHVSH